MQTQPILYGLIGFFIGGFIVAVAATTFDRPHENKATQSSMTLQDMSAALRDKHGDDYDAAFLAMMIEHHEGAIDMAEFSAKNAKHQEIKQLSRNISKAQHDEILQMKQWQKQWGYNDMTSHHSMEIK